MKNTQIFYKKNAPQARFFMKQNAPQERLIKQMRRRPDFLTKSSWVLCPVNAVKNDFPRISAQNLLLLINSLINELTFGQPTIRLFSPLTRRLTPRLTP